MKFTLLLLCLCVQLSAFAQNKLPNNIFAECATNETPYQCTNNALENAVLDLIDEDVISTLLETSKPYFSVSAVFILDANGVVIKEHTQIKTPSYLLTKRIQNYIDNLPAFTQKDSPVEKRRNAFFINVTLLRDTISKNYYVADNLDLKERNIKPDYIKPDEESIYPGCEKSDHTDGVSCSTEKMYNLIMKNYRMPEVDGPLQFRMIVNFYIDTTGKVQVENIEGGEEKFHKGILTAMTKLPRLTPTRIKGIPITIAYKLPITINVK
ncbi:hypothetical protein [Flavobacterium subsaxonicum]|uniref:TonB C-terminal domain-containing protein n=1 Tax=Flavobacterium subsaxonicum WB 4.1-42 = DSM 21790 TaxID=1121898 RepID=A0A0A2MRT8_9FLAO|nr:hypothetical protein [Flavobacterium subsaxonicum]KGO94148.1 hypothetical protein Q766_04240 [Flavobacterium subsaxonicum WB 4.1-42 = DSM 21790]